MLRSKFLAFAFLFAAAPAAQAADPMGVWARGDGVARVRIAPCGSQLCATNTWIKPGVTDEKVGDKLIMTVRPTAANTLTGTAWDPQRKLNFNIDITVAQNSLNTNGCLVGRFLCKSVDWTRVR